ncbi:hypothetical protein EIP91_002457 [Steccherinum ochraceum]|uniref:SMP-30/Gluconolactonase/LRE-like region domain-containing protein n=1 Tax=Steccherinum ochraceum TaxID=92696 RepID=A0A4R0RC58_9APHY|nr:hypothetical protein EIP91_002457 [Steccherinum ochraceum]
MGASFPVVLVVLVAVLGSLYQLVLTPVLTISGVLRQVDPLNNEGCRFVPELEGCEKMVHLPQSNLLYLACSRIASRPYWMPPSGHLNASSKALDDHIAMYNLDTGKVTRLAIESDYIARRGLQVHGMDVVASTSDPTRLFVYAVNHREPLTGDPALTGADSAIEVFSTTAGSSSMEYISTVEDSLILTPNDIAGFPDGKSFYFTNDHSVKLGMYRKLETFMGLASTNVGYCHVDHGCKVVARNIRGANGIAKGRNETVFVASLGGGIYVMNQQADHTLSHRDTIPSGGLPIDNISVDQDGAVWAAMFPRGIEIVKRFADMSKDAASSAWRFSKNVDWSSNQKYVAERFFEDAGPIAQGTTTVVHLPERRELYLTSAVATHMTICKI